MGHGQILHWREGRRNSGRMKYECQKVESVFPSATVTRIIVVNLPQRSFRWPTRYHRWNNLQTRPTKEFVSQSESVKSYSTQSQVYSATLLHYGTGTDIVVLEESFFSLVSNRLFHAKAKLLGFMSEIFTQLVNLRLLRRQIGSAFKRPVRWKIDCHLYYTYTRRRRPVKL